MDGASRTELLKTVEEQQEKITKYQNKLRDLVSAYKGVLNEKEALENSLQILGSSPTKNERKASVDRRQGQQKGREALSEDERSNDGSEVEELGHDELTQLKQQLSTLTSSMATLTQEKSKMEANYQAEKKSLRQEYEDRESNYEEDLSQLHNTVDELEDKLTKSKTRLREQQHEREKEQNDHGVMLKELQSLVASERRTKEQLETQCEELKFELEEQKYIPQQSTEEHEGKIKDLEKLVNNLKSELKKKVQNEDKPNEEMISLNKELKRLKRDHADVVTSERERVGVAQKMLQEVSSQGEERISSLEAKISELSKSVGDYERLRFQDQQTIAKLRERLTQLDLENTALAKATQPPPEVSVNTDQATGVTELVDNISKLMTQLIEVNTTSEKPLPVSDLLTLCELDETDLHASCKQQFDTLREEFERYKLRAQSVLKSKSTKDIGGSKEVDDLKSGLSDLKEKLWQVRTDKDELDQQHRQKQENLSKALVAVQQKHKHGISALDSEHQLKMAELNTEMKRHRDRTIALLAEKDRELEILKQRNAEFTYRHNSHSPGREQDIFEAGASSENEPQSSVVAELLSRTALLSGTPGETTLLHFAQEQARRDVEINSLRKHKHGLETAIREQQHSSVIKEEQLSDQIDLLKEEIRRNERNISRENANLEYLKNVVYKYMVCTDSVGRNQMLNAIATILEFSPKEKKSVHEHISHGWFSYGNAPKKK